MPPAKGIGTCVTEAGMLKWKGLAKAQVLPVTWLISLRYRSKQAQSQTHGWTEHTREAWAASTA